jgi:serine protease AprX
MWSVTAMVGAQDLWDQGVTGSGVGVALIDTGVTKVPGLDARGKVFDGPDFSFDSQDPALTRRDAFGHGTHLAGIIAGRDAVGARRSDCAATDRACLRSSPYRNPQRPHRERQGR